MGSSVGGGKRKLPSDALDLSPVNSTFASHSFRNSATACTTTLVVCRTRDPRNARAVSSFWPSSMWRAATDQPRLLTASGATSPSHPNNRHSAGGRGEVFGWSLPSYWDYVDWGVMQIVSVAGLVGWPNVEWRSA
jgi:hypothetical protein